MSPEAAKSGNWLARLYDRVLLVFGLIALLASAVYLLLSINEEKDNIDEGNWSIPVHKRAAEPVEIGTYEQKNSSLTDPFVSNTTNILMASEVRVYCVHGGCQMPIPYHAKICPYCAKIQPEVTEDFDRDADQIPDEWEEEHGLDPYDPNDALADQDQDLFNNLEEYTGQTDPNDADSFPPVWVKLRLERAKVNPFPHLFQGVMKREDGDKYQLNPYNERVDDRTYFLAVGESIKGWTIKGYEPDAHDGPTLVLEKGEATMRLVKNKPGGGGEDWRAIVISMLDGERFQVRVQSKLNVKRFTYNVVDINMKRIIITDSETGEELTIPRITSLEAQELKRKLSRPSGARDGGGISRMPGARYPRSPGGVPVRRNAR